MTEHYCIDCDEKMPCITANLASDHSLCLKELENDINE